MLLIMTTVWITQLMFIKIPRFPVLCNLMDIEPLSTYLFSLKYYQTIETITKRKSKLLVKVLIWASILASVLVLLESSAFSSEVFR